MVHFNAQFRSLRVVIVFVLSIAVFSRRTARAEERVATEEALRRIRVIAANLEARLEMTQNVQIWIVPVDERMVSVERIHKGASADDVFIIQLDQSFLEGLTTKNCERQSRTSSATSGFSATTRICRRRRSQTKLQ